MRRTILKLTFFALVVASTTAYATCDHGSTKCYKASQLVAALHYESSLSDLTKTCEESLQRIHPGRIIHEDPDVFGGIGPASKEWPQILDAFHVLTSEACGGDELTQTLLDQYRSAWEARLSERELNSALAFLNSREGRAFGKASTDVHRTVATEYGRRTEDLREAALKKFQRRVQEIMAR